MTTIQAHKSSMRTVPKAFRNSLKFTIPKQSFAQRDYGMMRIRAEVASTRYPTDAVFKKSGQIEAMELEHSSSKVHFKKDTSNTQLKEYDYTATPHPVKSVILDPKELVRHIEVINKKASFNEMKMNHSMTNLKPILRKASSALEKSKSFKKVTLIVPRSSTMVSHKDGPRASKLPSSYPIKDELIVSPCKKYPWNNKNLSFEDRRRFFHEAEFTIAINGKKMGDYFTAKPPGSIICEGDLSDQNTASNNEMETIISKLGFVKGPRDTFSSSNEIHLVRSNRSLLESKPKRTSRTKRLQRPTPVQSQLSTLPTLRHS